MITATQDETRYRADFEALVRRLKGEPSWLDDIRHSAFERFCDLGFPTPADEEWRFTNVEPIAAGRFALPDGREAAAVSADQLTRFAIAGLPGEGGSTLVFIDGRLRPELSCVRAGDGVTLRGLADAIAADGRALSRHLARHADAQDDAFNALNVAFLEDGAFVHVAPNVAAAPIYVLNVTTGAQTPRATHPRNLIVVDRGAQATVVERYVSLTDQAHFTNAVTEIVAGDNSTVHHYLLADENHNAFNVSTLRAVQGRDSDLRSHSVLLGARLVRNNVHVTLDGDGCHSLLNGLFMPAEAQHMDNHMRVEHVGLHGASRQFYNGILSGRSRGVFSGRIIVRPGAQKTDAKQTNRNLLLSDTARVDTKPQLEIHADDVKCTHGATIGQIDPDALFYLRSRGIPEPAARGLVVYAFAAECLDRMDLEAVRDRLRRVVLERLPDSRLLESVL